jgi:hypothetical protein
MCLPRVGVIVHTWLDQPARHHHGTAHHREVPAIGPDIVVARNRAVAREGNALAGDGSEKAARQREAVIGSPSTDPHHVAGQDPAIEPVRAGADQDDVGEEEAQPDRIVGGRRLGSERGRGRFMDKPDRPTSDAQRFPVASDLAPIGEDDAGAAAHALTVS